MMFEVIAGSATVIGSGLIGYLLSHATRIAKLEEHAVNHEKMDEIRFQHMEGAISRCADSVERLATSLVNGGAHPWQL